MISTNDLRPGMTIVHGGRLCDVLEYQHVKPGKGGAFVRVKLKDIETGQALDHTWKGEQKVEQAYLENRKLEYIYRDGNLFYFMDLETYDQMAIDGEKVTHLAEYMKENTEVTVTFHGDHIVGVKLPDFMALQVAKTDPGLKGDTATGGTKPATLETGAMVQVPLFINEGDVLKVDTRTGTYVERM